MAAAQQQTAALRILCLHDGNSTAAELKDQFQLLGKKLYEQHAIDLVYVNSPITTVAPAPAPEQEMTAEGSSSAAAAIDETAIRRVWWEEVEQSSPTVAPPKEKDTFENSPTDASLDENLADKHLHAVTTRIGDDAASSGQQQQTPFYRGLDASLMLLRQIWTSCPFWGILGVGQGAAVAALLLAILESVAIQQQATAAVSASADQETGQEADQEGLTNSNLSLGGGYSTLAPPQFAIFVSGESLVPVDEPLLVESSDNFPVLHLVDDNDSTNAVARPQQDRLIRQFPCGAVEHRRSAIDTISGEGSCFDSHDLNLIGRFVIQRKKELFGTSATNCMDAQQPSSMTLSQEILALQTALHLAEQDAADCLAETIALNPPAALMAVIRPQAVAGWKGNRRRQPGEEGGGAPCPSEFLLHRQERASAAAGASRVHPKNHTSPETEN